MIILPLYIAINWDRVRERGTANGIDFEQTGVNPYEYLDVRFISASGVEYGNGFNPSDHPADVVANLPDPALWNVGAMYPPAESVNCYVYVSVPSSEVAGGAWKVTNGTGDIVFLAP